MSALVCISCLRGFYDECGHDPPKTGENSDTSIGGNSSVNSQSGSITDELAQQSETSPSASDYDADEQPTGKRSRRTKPDDAVRDQQSTGRKRAARLYPLHREELCEWAEASDDNPKGGGTSPIVIGCFKTQQARHHGPEKNTLNNDPGNVHRICHWHHNLWHRMNDPNYDPNHPIIRD